MLEKAVLPFTESLHSLLEVENGLSDAPLLLSIEVKEVRDSQMTMHFTDLQVPKVPTINSIELTSVTFKTKRGSVSRKVHVLAQRLDLQGRRSGIPVPLVAANTCQCTAPLRFKMYAGDHVRLLLIENGSGPGVCDLILSGYAIQDADFFPSSRGLAAALLSWAPAPFSLVEEGARIASKKRGRSLETKSESQSGDTDDEPPRLVYALVYGDEDES